MNSSSIVMAFIFSGVLSVFIHHVALGPIVLGPNQAVVSQTDVASNGSPL